MLDASQKFDIGQVGRATKDGGSAIRVGLENVLDHGFIDRMSSQCMGNAVMADAVKSFGKVNTKNA